MGEKAVFNALSKSAQFPKVPSVSAVWIKDSLHPAVVPPFIKERVKIILFSSELKIAELIRVYNPISCRNLFNFSGSPLKGEGAQIFISRAFAAISSSSSSGERKGEFSTVVVSSVSDDSVSIGSGLSLQNSADPVLAGGLLFDGLFSGAKCSSCRYSVLRVPVASKYHCLYE